MATTGVQSKIRSLSPRDPELTRDVGRVEDVVGRDEGGCDGKEDAGVGSCKCRILPTAEAKLTCRMIVGGVTHRYHLYEQKMAYALSSLNQSRTRE